MLKGVQLEEKQPIGAEGNEQPGGGSTHAHVYVTYFSPIGEYFVFVHLASSTIPLLPSKQSSACPRLPHFRQNWGLGGRKQDLESQENSGEDPPFMREPRS